jgi:hypothetical protein
MELEFRRVTVYGRYENISLYTELYTSACVWAIQSVVAQRRSGL